jgi:hypothetical protein
VHLGAQGWPSHVELGQALSAVLPSLAGGEYLMIYEGRGVVRPEAISGRLVIREEVPGRTRFIVEPGGTFAVTLFETTSADPVRHIRVVPPELEAISETAVFHPRFLESIERFKVLRFTDWMRTDSSLLRDWKDRTSSTLYTQAQPGGVAYEYIVRLCNTVGADPWISVPAEATDAFVEELALLFLDHLDSGLRVHLELSSEAWIEDAGHSQGAYAKRKGLEAKLAPEPELAKLRWHSRRSVEVFKIFTRVFGGSERLVRIMASPAGNVEAHEELLGFEGAKAHVDALAVAPTFGRQFGVGDDAVEVEARELEWLLKGLRREGLHAMTLALERSAAWAKAAGIPLVAYAGGERLLPSPAFAGSATLAKRFTAARRHAEMKSLYLEMFAAWKRAGGRTFVLDPLAADPARHGVAGLLESQSQDRKEAPKYDAALTWIETSPAGW